MLEQLAMIVACQAPTLIEGETGSGKELAARAIHYGGLLRSGPFVPVNCGALPDSLVESELFGVQRGAFTDARQSRHGLVAEAEGGTLFLDEVDALSAKAQVALLRFVQDQRYRPVGTAREHCTQVRLIAAANRPLDQLVELQLFRADLMYRLKILHLVMPPLRERGDDVEQLAQCFVARFAAEYGRAPLPLDPATRVWLRQQRWPGNVRELENWVHRAFLACRGAAILPQADAAVLTDAPAPPSAVPAPLAPADGGFSWPCAFAQAKAIALQRFETDYLRRALEEAGGNVTRAARLAGKERRAFGKLLKKHGIAAHPRPTGS